jgi:hypothetical protein
LKRINRKEASMSATAPKPPAGPPILELGGTATAKVSFKDGFGNSVTPTSVQWMASPSHVVVVAPDASDPATAELQAITQGTTTVMAVGQADGASVTASIFVTVLRPNVPVAGSIAVTA